jgi:pyruvate kinase
MEKILITLGPGSLNDDIIQKMDKEGVYLFRLNMSHTPLDKLEEIISSIQRVSNTPICIDSEGAQVRNLYMENEKVLFTSGDKITIHFSDIVGDSYNISLNNVNVAKQLSVNDEIRIDFNGVKIKVVEMKNDFALANVISGGTVGSNKAITVNKIIKLPAITEKDKAAIQIGKELGIRNYALSFSGSMSDVKRMRELTGTDAVIISKIESLKALNNLDEIIKESDEILIDRGDLSREVRIEKIPFLQRIIIAHAKAFGVPVYVATNLLESMISFDEPNRAEVNDIISTLIMGSDGLVLAAETAVGEFPLECVRMIRKLINQYHHWTPNSRINEILGL